MIEYFKIFRYEKVSKERKEIEYAFRKLQVQSAREIKSMKNKNSEIMKKCYSQVSKN
jgi:hypothetical protein